MNSWRSYEQCLFFSCFVCCVHVNMGVRMNVRMPVGFDSAALPFFIRHMSLCLMGSTFPSFLNICMRRSLSRLIAHNPQCNFVLDVWAVRRSNSNQHQNFKHLGGLDRAKVCQDCGENHPQNRESALYFTTRSIVKN